MEKNFCNTTSARGKRWEIRERSEGELPVVQLRDGTTVPAEVVDIIRRRGVEDVAAYLEPSLRAFMPDPSKMTAMDDAVARICEAFEKGQKVSIFGDYDVDGATSSSIFVRYMRMLGQGETRFYIPQRMTEGYGPNVNAMQTLRDEGTELLIIADSGTTAFEPVNKAVELGMDVIILDHHEPKETGELPPAIVVNPKRIEEDGSLSYLCTAGLMMMFLVAVNRHLRDNGFFERNSIQEPNLPDLFGIVALGTVADVVPLKELNRAFVSVGLKAMGKIEGIRALSKVTEQEEFNARACGFVFGPCINAGGRISDTMQGTRLLSTDDPAEAKELADRLFELNRERQTLQKEMVSECMQQVTDSDNDDLVIVAYNPDWHPGVVGLGASKVMDRFDRSAVVIGQGGKGSGRAVPGFNIGKAFIKAAEQGLLIKGGGHAAAGGLTIDPDKLDEFRAFVNKEAEGFIRPPTKVDLAVPVGGLSQQAVEAFELMAPFGMGNSKPRVAFTGGILESTRILKGAHIKGRICNEAETAFLDIIVFNAVDTPFGDAILKAEGHFVDFMGEVDLNTYGGRTTIQMKPEDVMVGAAASAEVSEAEAEERNEDVAAAA